jgi:hypothetical protein
VSDLPDRVLENLRALGADIDRLPEIPPELAEYIAAMTPEDLERIRADMKGLERIGREVIGESVSSRDCGDRIRWRVITVDPAGDPSVSEAARNRRGGCCIGGAAPASRASGAFRISDHRRERMCSGRIGFSSAVSRLVAALLLSIAPGRLEAAEGAGDLPSALVVVDGARKVVRQSAKNELDQVSVFYDVNTPYPASAVIAEIRGKLENVGWKPLPRESISAINPSSLRVRWRT